VMGLVVDDPCHRDDEWWVTVHVTVFVMVGCSSGSGWVRGRMIHVTVTICRLGTVRVTGTMHVPVMVGVAVGAWVGGCVRAACGVWGVGWPGWGVGGVIGR
jgi:hypothetical protein